MVGGVLYYIMLFVVSLSAGIYNFSVYSTGSKTICYDDNPSIVVVSINVSSNPPNSSNSSLQQINLVNNVSNSCLIQSSIIVGNYQYDKSTNPLSSLQILLAIFYILICSLSFVLVLIINNMANMVPDDFLKIGNCKKFMAVFTKIFPPFFIVLHYVIFIIILAQCAMIINKTCYNSIFNCGAKSDNRYYNTSYILNIVTSIIWIFLHYIAAVIRDIVYQEPFMYSPPIGKLTYFGIILKRIGP